MHAFHSLNVGLESDVWFEYVASAANIADLPSRGDTKLLRRLKSTERAVVLPSIDDWDLPASAWMERATANAHAAPARAGAARGARRWHAVAGDEEARVPRKRSRGGGGRGWWFKRGSASRARDFGSRWVVHVASGADYDVYVGRATVNSPACDETSRRWGWAGRWGNPFVMAGKSDVERDRVCDAHRAALLSDLDRILDVRLLLAGKILACWCGDGRRCHADDLAQVANCSQADFDALMEQCEACGDDD